LGEQKQCWPLYMTSPGVVTNLVTASVNAQIAKASCEGADWESAGTAQFCAIG